MSDQKHSAEFQRGRSALVAQSSETTDDQAADRRPQSANEPTPAPVRSRRYTASERAQRLQQIETQIANGSTLRAAAKNAGVTEQTFYQWKRSANANNQRRTETPVILESISDLLSLEAENQRLRILLTTKLREENAELKKRLGVS